MSVNTFFIISLIANYYANNIRYNPINIKLTWDDASQYCNNIYSNLAIISNQNDRNDAIKYCESLNDNCWIGLSDTNDNAFKWINGDELIYTNWDTNQPNKENNRNCVYMDQNSNKWNDGNCDETNAFLCDYPRYLFIRENPW